MTEVGKPQSQKKRKWKSQENEGEDLGKIWEPQDWDSGKVQLQTEA